MRLLFASIALVAMLPVTSCAAHSGSPAASVTEASMLQSSDPSPGSTVAGPVNALVLRFSPAARLDEVVVTGPDGAMPMMITAAGEQPQYSVPLPGLGAGAYTVAWRATAGTRADSGSFAFTVK